MNSRNLIFVIAVFAAINLFAQSTDKKFGKDEILEDLTYLYESLKDAHYNVYAYQSKENFDITFTKLHSAVYKDSLNTLEATTLLQKLISVVNNGHTEIDFPGASYKAYAFNQGTVFPLEISFEDHKCLVRKNFSTNTDIKIGSELIRINGMSMTAILSKIYPQISAERTYFKNAKIETYSFPRYFWQVYGKQDRFEIEIKEGNVIKKYSIAAINLIEGYETKRDDVLNAQMMLKFYDDASYINPGNFSGDETKYQKFIDSSFTKINTHKSKNLIIDLRNNNGGDNSFSDYLVSYIANKPFKWNSRLTLKSSKFLKEHTRKFSDTTDVYFQNILNRKNGEIYDYTFEPYIPQAKEKRFTGNVYVLINRQSHSQSALTGAQIQDYKLGTLVGEETGDYPSLYASQFQYPLPNTGIIVKVAKGYIVRVNGSKAQKGVIPDVLIKDHLLDENDEILDGVLQLLKEKR